MAGSQHSGNRGKISTSDRILVAAKELFASNGYENTSTMSIARAALTSESQMVKHFGSKEGLLEAIFEDGWKHISAAAAGMRFLPSPSAQLQALMGIILGKFGEDDQLMQLFLLEGRRIRKEGHMILMTQGFLDLVKTIDGLLKEMRELGELTSDLHIEGIRSALIGMMEGLLRDKMIAARTHYPASFQLDDIRKLFLHVLKGFSAPAQKNAKDEHVQSA